MKKFFKNFLFTWDFIFSSFGLVVFLIAYISAFFHPEFGTFPYFFAQFGTVCGFVCCWQCLTDHISSFRKSSGKKSVDNK